MTSLKKTTTTPYYEKFEELLKGNKRLLAKSAEKLGTKKEIMKKFIEDSRLNTMPSYLFNKYFVLDTKKYSLSDNISLIKHYLIFYYIKAAPIFIDKPYLYKEKDKQN